MYICVCVYIYICMNVYMYVCMYVLCMYVRTYICVSWTCRRFRLTFLPICLYSHIDILHHLELSTGRVDFRNAARTNLVHQLAEDLAVTDYIFKSLSWWKLLTQDCLYPLLCLPLLFGVPLAGQLTTEQIRCFTLRTLRLKCLWQRYKCSWARHIGAHGSWVSASRIFTFGSMWSFGAYCLGIVWLGGSLGFRDGLGTLEKKEIFCLCQELKRDFTPLCSVWSIQYTDWAIPALQNVSDMHLTLVCQYHRWIAPPLRPEDRILWMGFVGSFQKHTGVLRHVSPRRLLPRPFQFVIC